MTIGRIFKREVISAPKDMSVIEAAKLMKKHKIGDIVVIDNQKDGRPIGIFTDRDITVEIVADKVEPASICIGDAMSEELLILQYHLGVREAVDSMCAKGVRRAPVVDQEGKVIGIVTLDDLILLLADELA